MSQFDRVPRVTPQADDHRGHVEAEEMSEGAVASSSVYDRAMEESRDYFDRRYAAMETLFADEHEAVGALIASARVGETLTHDGIRKALRILEEFDGVVELVEKAVTYFATHPEIAVDEAAAKTVDSTLRELEPENQMAQTRAAFAEGRSWYHTTPEGRERLQHLQEHHG